MGLKEYRGKRDFEKTPEPAPAARRGRAKDLFVVQKHDATNLHYDLRLQIGDVLKSWAIPKGPSLDPREKRLAIEVEDHPLKYAEFEGSIPAGQYGGGTVMIWDTGRWSAETDAAQAHADGMIKFRLDGKRLKGRWMLVRSKRSAKQPQWLLIKERDAEASAGVHAETFATSVTTGRTMEEIAAGASAKAPDTPAAEQLSAAELTAARKSPMPAKLKPQLAVPANTAPDGDDWLHEVKFDGYRLLIFKQGDEICIRSRTGLDWTAKLTTIAAEIRQRLPSDAIIDGEAVVLDARGVSDFQALQNAIHNRRSAAIIFFAFDLPWCDGFDLTKAPLQQRRALLSQMIGRRQEGRLRFSDHVEGGGPQAFERACAHGLEGIVSKKKNSPWTESRTPAWVKVKCFNQQEFVIGGYSEPEGSREQFGALHLGYYDAAGKLRFAGKVGTGFSRETLKAIATQLRPLAVSKPPFSDPPTRAEARGVTWVQPKLVAQVQFRDWTADGHVRHTSFRGLREDIAAASVVRETTVSASAQQSTSARAAKPAAKKSSAVQEPTQSRSRLTNPERFVFPDRGAGYALTKSDIYAYYEAVAERMLEQLANRPLAIVRCPSGEGGKAFFQKHPAKGMPLAVRGLDISGENGETERHLMIQDADGLLGLVQMNALEFHPWGSTATNVEHPDRLVFDLDPGPGVTWKQLVEGAVLVREALRQLKLGTFARVSGGKGIHVVVPIVPSHSWESALAFCRAVAETLVRVAPRRFVATSTIAQRENRIYVDYLRNTRGATAIASYSTRARPGAPIALPVAWDELAGLPSASCFNPAAVLRRLKGSPDPWSQFATSAAGLPGQESS